MDIETQHSELVEQVNSGSVTFTDLVRLLAGGVKPSAIPEVLPVPAVITSSEVLALKKFNEAFGVVVPTSRRALTPVELEQLVEERSVLDTMSRMVARRIKNIRTTVLNHFDVRNEGKGVGEDALRNDEGHYLVAIEERIPGLGKRFVWQIAQTAPKISVSKLAEMADDPDCEFSRADYLALTEVPKPSRVLSAEKAMAAIKANPALMEHLVTAIEPPRVTGSLFLRDQK